jgi:predicted transcriptional regulator
VLVIVVEGVMSSTDESITDIAVNVKIPLKSFLQAETV